MRTHLALSVLLCSCASAAPSDPAPASAQADSAPALAVSGRYLFALDDSDPSAAAREGCAARDRARADDCYREILAQASSEGLRFDTDAQGRTIFVSFGREGGAEAVYHAAPVTLTSGGPRVVVSTSLAAATGMLAGTRPIPAGTALRIEVSDPVSYGGRTVAGTIALNDPKKGRLVFHRAE